jgi:signal transduction histidine kinase
MRIPRPRLSPLSWPRLPRRTARLRLTVLYGGVCLAFGVVLLAVSYLLARQGTTIVQVSATRAVGSGLHVPLSVQQLRQPKLQDGAAYQAAFLRGVGFEREQLLIWFGIALAIGAAVAVMLGWVMGGRVLRPLRKITTTARRISASNLNERLSLHGPDDELKALGDTLDDLFARLEASFEAQRHFVANASHELRTPLTRERAMLQVALDDPGTTTETWRSTTREVLASNTEQESLIEALLTLASSQGGLDQRELVDLAAVTGEVLRARRRETGRMGLHIQAAAQPAALDGDSLLIERLVANLIDNAVRHNITDGRVEIATGTKDGCAVLSVINTGPVIPPAEVDRLFQPFQRLNGRRARHNKGHGLGLSIVRAIATAHGATITAQPRPGGGLTVDITFKPADRPPRPSHQERGTLITSCPPTPAVARYDVDAPWGAAGPADFEGGSNRL